MFNKINMYYNYYISFIHIQLYFELKDINNSQKIAFIYKNAFYIL